MGSVGSGGFAPDLGQLSAREELLRAIGGGEIMNAGNSYRRAVKWAQANADRSGQPWIVLAPWVRQGPYRIERMDPEYPGLAAAAIVTCYPRGKGDQCGS